MFFLLNFYDPSSHDPEVFGDENVVMKNSQIFVKDNEFRLCDLEDTFR